MDLQFTVHRSSCCLLIPDSWLLAPEFCLSDTPLEGLLLDTLRRTGAMTFERYMALCLYHPEFGYYTRGRERTGAQGDYFTSPDLHPVFARLLARQAAEMWECLERPRRFTWVEMGAGRGLFACDFLSWVKRALPELAAALDYVAIEPGPRERQRIQERLANLGLEREVRLLTNLEELAPTTGCFFSNELVDAFPVSVVTRTGGHLKEIYVTAEGGDLHEEHGPISDPSIAAYVARYANQLEEDQRVEVNRQAVEWMRAIAQKLTRGFVVTIDYGDSAEHLYTAERPRGTLLAYRGHTASEDFFGTPGEGDLTAHVNFSALVDAGGAAGLDLTGFTTQERFLLGLGEANEFADVYDPGQTELEKMQARLKLKRLVSVAGMGKVFKVLIQHRGVSKPQLTGLKYARSEAG
jgi:SAM-dependent MidA family methyltransferase